MSDHDTEAGTLPRSWTISPSAWLLRRLARALESGRIRIRTPSGQWVEHRAAKPGIEATLIIHRWRAIRRLLVGGTVAFAEAYIDGDWSSPDVTALFELSARNLTHISAMVGGLPPVRIANRVRHLMRRNSKPGSRRNIAFHYDLGNEFYRHWLDMGMTYSSALYEEQGDTLEAAQDRKLDRIADLLGAVENRRILEIGCGWGALAERLGRSGAEVRGITLSAEQLAYARERIAGAGLADRVELELTDYRDVTGKFDRIVSIEMFEAVGEQYWPAYFQTLRDRLAPGGEALLQVITIDESRFDAYRSGADFIQRYIFPGGMLPTRTMLGQQAEAAGLTLVGSETFGASYARTLADWRSRFQSSWPAIARLGFDTRFKRLWEFYLSYCEAGFRASSIDVGLYRLRAPD